jgi:hypothetical protein
MTGFPSPRELDPDVWTEVLACPDEWTALTLEAELRGAGIPCWVRSSVVPGYQGLVGFAFPHWGVVSVARRDWMRARAIVLGLGLDDDSPARSGRTSAEEER